MTRAVEEAYANGALGANAFGSGTRIDVVLHRGAGAYICGEETAMMNSIEGKRGNPRIKPPFPAQAGVFGMPTTINNVETLCVPPHILTRGAEWYKGLSLSSPKSTGTKLFSVCGHVQRPGNYEVTMGTPMRELIFDMAGGMRPGRTLKAVIPGGSSVPIMSAAEVEGCAAGLRGHRGEGLDARLGRRHRDGRQHRHGEDDLALHEVLRPRVVRPVHPVPRGHGMDHQGARADPLREGQARPTCSCCSTWPTT